MIVTVIIMTYTYNANPKGNHMTLKAIATQIGNSKKEAITVGRDTVRKSVDIGKYNYVCLLYVGGQEKPHIGCSGTRENASKWAPGPLVYDVYPARKSDGEDYKAQVQEHYNALKAAYGKPQKIRKMGYTFYRFKPSVHRVVLKIER